MARGRLCMISTVVVCLGAGSMIVGKRGLWSLGTSTESEDYTRRDVRGLGLTKLEGFCSGGRWKRQISFFVKLDMMLAVRSWTTLSYTTNEAVAYPFSPPISFSSTVQNVFPFTIRTGQRTGSLRSLSRCQIIIRLLRSTVPHTDSAESGDLMRWQYRALFS